MPDEPPRTPETVLNDLADTFAAWLTVLGTWKWEDYPDPKWALEPIVIATVCGLQPVPPLFRELALAKGYDFDAWIADLAEKGTSEAKELADKVFTALDNLAGAG